MTPPPSPASRPLAAAVGLAVLGVTKARDLPGKALMASLAGVGAALSVPATLRREYDQLAAQGERVLARLNGRIEPEDAAGDGGAAADEWVARPVFPSPPVGPAMPAGPGPVFPPPPAAPVFPPPPAAPVFPAPPTSPAPVPPAAAPPRSGPAPDTTNAAADAVAVPAGADSAPPPVSEPPLHLQHQEAVAHLVQEASAVARAQDLPAGGELSADQLPLEDFDHLTLGSLRGRLRRLSAAELVQLREYELAHAHRLPILTMLDNRIAKLEAERAATAG